VLGFGARAGLFTHGRLVTTVRYGIGVVLDVEQER